jgi:3-hydroxybutyryl-CoA dehydrogenase
MRNTGLVGIDSVGVVGLGTMGAGIAEVFARSGLTVVAVEIDDALADAGRRRIVASLERAVDRGRLEAAERDAVLGRFVFSTDRGRLASADLVIEAVPERLEMKASLFDELDRICPPATILATNTSSLPVTQIAAATGRPDRVVGMHFFNPAPVMRLVEVVHTVLSDADAVASVRDLASRCGKTPVVVADRAGFVANALLFGYLNQAARMAETGHATTTDIDVAMTAACGLPMGPLSLMDLIGLDVCLEVLEVMYAETRDQRYAAAPLLRRLVMARHLGRKTGRGYYSYEAGAPEAVTFGGGRQPDGEPEAVRAAGPTLTVAGADDQLVADVTKLLTARFDLAAEPAAADVVVHVPAAPRHGTVVEVAARNDIGHLAAAAIAAALQDDGRTVVSCKDRPGFIVEALLYPHLNDAARMVDDAYASSEDVDTAMRLGCGYPTGPFEMLDAVGASVVVDRLPEIAAAMPSAAVATSALLHDLARG